MPLALVCALRDESIAHVDLWPSLCPQIQVLMRFCQASRAAHNDISVHQLPWLPAGSCWILSDLLEFPHIILLELLL